MSGEQGETEEERLDDRRRRLLGYGTLAALAGSGVAGALYATRSGDAPESTPTETETPPDTPTATPTDEVPAVVRRYAPDLYFGVLEKWFPTDPRPYAVETEEGPVVDGFAALEEYSAAFTADDPPAPTVFYRVTEAAAGVDAIQYWMYSVFDQFTVNFHWHDWELLQVFVERDSGDPLLVSASAHSRAVPNNEFLEPVLGEGRRPGVLAEVGSHSSASEVNDLVPSFERVATDAAHPDVSNDAVGFTSRVNTRFAYGLPRGEGARLPFVMPELDGDRLDDHPELSVGPGDFVDEAVTVGSWRGLPRPPSDLPLREPGLVLSHADSSAGADATYDLEPIGVVRDAVDDFVGPQLSFEFAIPGFVEDQFAGHITSVGIPWEQPRFTDPLADVTDPEHRRRIDGQEPPGLRNRVVGRVRRLRSGTAGALDNVSGEARSALEDAATVSLSVPSTDVVARLSSEHPVATGSRAGEFGFLHVEAGPHLLVVNGPGVAPLAARFVHDGGLVRVGANGELTVVANEDAGWIRGDGRAASGIAHVRVTEDYAGIVYDGQPVETDRFAAAVHAGGRYTVEVEDADGRPGAYRVTPSDFGDDGAAVRETVETGKAPLVRALRDTLDDLVSLTRALAERDGAGGEVGDRVSVAFEEAEAAATSAERGDGQGADDGLSQSVSALEEALEILGGDRQGGYSDASVAGLEPRFREAIQRAETAIGTELA